MRKAKIEKRLRKSKMPRDDQICERNGEVVQELAVVLECLEE